MTFKKIKTFLKTLLKDFKTLLLLINKNNFKHSFKTFKNKNDF